jgi:general secretion pathway protein J
MNSQVRGFTLLELLAAIAIFAVMALMAYGGLSAVLRARATVETSLARTAEVQKAIYRLQSDIELARARPVRDEYGDIQPAFVSREASREIPRLEFTRGGRRNPRLQARSAFERIAYGVKDGSLVRYSWTTLDRAQDDTLTEIPLLDGVESLDWRFLDLQREWHPSWPPRNSQQEQFDLMPIAVELRLRTKDWGEIRYLFRIIAGVAPENTDPPPATGGGGDDGSETAGDAQ